MFMSLRGAEVLKEDTARGFSLQLQELLTNKARRGSDKEKNIGILCDSQNFPSTSDSLAVKEDAEYSCKEQITEDDINISNGEILNVKCTKGTPPDAEMLSYRFAENGGSYSKETGQASQDPSIGSVLKRGSEKKDIGNNAATKFAMVSAYGIQDPRFNKL
ncbi:hypothetical protein OIU84_012116 [Salix udensis]|uniref:Uncharacterized protein n=1 Tax=Salix udensis TaxID=889485 RepID=A0AAD6JEZ5_9ROSI|nr:hypothetical protein OIU84_012116 [Salix udensis]